MDVVKTTVEQLGGTIEVDSKEKIGMEIRLIIPLSLPNQSRLEQREISA